MPFQVGANWQQGLDILRDQGFTDDMLACVVDFRVEATVGDPVRLIVEMLLDQKPKPRITPTTPQGPGASHTHNIAPTSAVTWKTEVQPDGSLKIVNEEPIVIAPGTVVATPTGHKIFNAKGEWVPFNTAPMPDLSDAIKAWDEDDPPDLFIPEKPDPPMKQKKKLRKRPIRRG